MMPAERHHCHPTTINHVINYEDKVMNSFAMKITDTNSTASHKVSGSTFKTACVAIIWVSDGVSEQSQKQALLTAVKQQPGVSSARFSMEIPLLMVVNFEPEHTRASTVVKTINGPGVRARIVGC